ncbi:hypothetical protein SISNIDRAFT_460103 [Sistotremastrum niveocremeum HHB9708]|uniref:LsmAD domain-containing protein n=2 Tax=Sistotremastraceae TaxID=3402574 RepID=A0A164NUH4_9AGAM|nr:hypothetical protein SISNIDRAFT_460103 [Sistotremastrum niveocremeum HHB9708]KZT40520.1 hypothetical protein SISSUDRAFT_1044246 [Sistotremastrum suecicum HHB10207 ss-3]
MSSSVRQLNKASKKSNLESNSASNTPPANATHGSPGVARKANAWNRAPQTFPNNPPPSASPRLSPPVPQGVPGAFPPLAQPGFNGSKASSQDEMLRDVAPLMGSVIMFTTRTGQRHQGTLVSTTQDADNSGVQLKDVKDLLNPTAPLKDNVFIRTKDVEGWSPVSKPNGSSTSFRIDNDISSNAPRRERDLEVWEPPASSSATQNLQGDDATFGAPATTGGAKNWDQFAANEQMFGVTTSFDEELYTTKLDRSGPDFKERERKAQQLANEIMSSTTSNPHIAEERNLVDDSGMNEEDKYGAVVRSANAYVPPGARKGNVVGPTSNHSQATPPIPEVPKVSINGVESSDTTPLPKNASRASTNPSQGPNGLVDNFREFVSNEKERLTQKRHALRKTEMDKVTSELVKFSQVFKLNRPIPEDLVTILAKDEDKQKAIREKASADAGASSARTIGSTVTTTSPNAQKTKASISPSSTVLSSKAVSPTSSKPSEEAATKKEGTSKSPAKPTIKMEIQPIPPFNPSKARGSSVASTSVSPPNQTGTPASPTVSTAAAATKLNINASSFKPNPNANSFKPSQPISTPGSSSSQSPKTKTTEPPAPPNPFFGTKPVKKSSSVHVKDDFNPFKFGKVAEASSIISTWPFSGKRYMSLFPPVTHQPPPGHMTPPGPPPLPTFEEDPSQGPNSRQYLYTYAPYPYPGQVRDLSNRCIYHTLSPCSAPTNDAGRTTTARWIHAWSLHAGCPIPAKYATA